MDQNVMNIMGTVINRISILAPTAVPQLRLVEPGGQYVLEQYRPFSIRCIADTYPVSNITWSHTNVFGPGIQSRKNGMSKQQEG